MVKFYSLKTSANNIGEEIQILAASRFYPVVDKYLNKERLNKYIFNEPAKIIINGWFMRNYDRFHLKDNKILPLLISIHITPTIAKKFFRTKRNCSFLSENSPVGCRDTWTLKLLKEHNINSYYSGCLTLTLQKNPNIKKEKYILLIDCPTTIEEHLKKLTDRQIINLHPVFNFYNTFEDRLNLAKLYLKKIQQAYLVISSRLHACLPALALETKSVFIIKNDGGGNTQKERCSDVYDLIPAVEEKDFINKYKTNEDIEKIYMTKKYIALRNTLINKCKEFTGYDNTQSVIPNTSDIEDEELLFNLMVRQRDNNKILFDINISQMLKNIYTRVILRKNDDDIF